jgi:ADP-ribosyl-[dinitrogen reductase] hydrolase
MELSTEQVDRAVGTLLANAAGDALGAPYEFEPARGPELEVAMVGGGAFRWDAGEWTDDTSMAIAIAEVAAKGLDLRDEDAQTAIVQRWFDWAKTATDVGNQTRSVLGATGRAGISGANALAAARDHYERNGHSAGNGSLMRTSPVALAYLDDEDALAEAAATISALTHYDPDAQEACVLWCLAIRHAVLTGVLDVRIGLNRLADDRRALWADRLDVAERSTPSDFRNNGWVVEALQAAWCAIHTTPVPVDDPQAGVFAADHLRLALDAAVRSGNDTDTVAAIAGALLGATWGASAVPGVWRRVLHGWPDLETRGLVQLATRIIKDDKDFPRPQGPLRLFHHPYDDGVLLGNAQALLELPPDVDAIVSLCRVHDDDLPAGVEQIDVRLVDRTGPDENPHLEFVLTDTVRLVEQLRGEGRTVLVHCHGAYSRTPTIGGLYGARYLPTDGLTALNAVIDAVPEAAPNGAFWDAIERLEP